METKSDMEKKQKRFGLAPIASFEDISDEMENSSSVMSKLPKIKDLTSNVVSSATQRPLTISTEYNAANIKLEVNTPSTPRIDISRASSSSHHDSRDSSPENVFDQVGTGTLQETCLGGFREEGALDLRSSTEELHFMEQEDSNNKVENRDQIASLPQTQISRRSPIIFKLEEHQPYIYTQHQRKDSASSEVAALLSISGRTSRISSVGSQGSAVSRLSAISGVSRSPSPHRMLLETSFCGPKPVVDSICESTVITGDDSPAEILEQVILSRKQDPTQAVLAEGIQIDFNESPKKLNNTNFPKEMELKVKTIGLEKLQPKPVPTVNRVRIGTVKKLGEKKDPLKPIIGVTPNGTEYIRIKLKPDHLYNDKGLAKNERIVDEPIEEVLKKPVSLNLNVNTSIQIEEIEKPENIPVTVTNINLKNHASPKPVRYTGLSKEQESRSPSPAPVSISRKSSFCSLFKSIDTIISPDSPRDRSRSKSRDRGSSGSGFESIINSTPNKQKSVLAIFKPGSRKGSESKSKNTSPVEAVDHSIREHRNNNDTNHLSQVEFRFKPPQSCSFPTTPQSSGRTSRSRLRYYDAADGAIHIPLHTPPEEKETSSINEFNLNCILSIRENSNVNELPEFSKPNATSNNLPLSPNNLKSKLSFTRIENNDDTLIIPLRASKLNTETSIPEQQKQQLSPIDATIFSNDFETSNWSIEVQRHSSQESQATVIAAAQKFYETPSTNNNNNNNPIAFNKEIQNPDVGKDLPNYSKNSKSDKEESNNKINSSKTNIIMLPPATPNALTREKKQILFSTKIGSGSEEQIFSTQFSLSKTESLSSQISESATICEVPTPNSIETLTLSSPKLQIDARDELNLSFNRRTLSRNNNSEKVIVRPKKQTLQEELSSVVEIYQEKIISNGKNNSNNRDSKYIENVDEIMEAQKKLTAGLAKNKRINCSEEGSPIIDAHSNISPINEVSIANYGDSIFKSIQPTVNHEINGSLYLKQSVMMTPATSSDYHGSSESEKESENGSSTSSRQTKARLTHHHHHHHARSLGSTIDDHESAGLVSQQSFEEDLPYIPTTLPEERARGVSLIPVKERINMEIKMCPVDRPRSTTPINPASLEEYCGVIITTSENCENLTPRADKLRISLPRRNSKEHEMKFNLFNSAIETKSPRRITTTSSQKNWFDFAAKQNNVSAQKPLEKDIEDQPPPPLPPRRVSGSLTSALATINAQQETPVSSNQQWINFEEIPEKRKIPKKITTLPAKEQSHHHNVQYSFVNPEDCQCECHENQKIMTTLLTDDNIILEAKNLHRPLNNYQAPPEDIQPLLQPDHSDCLDRASDSSVDYSYGGCQLSIGTCTRQSDTNELLADKPFGIDLSVNISSSNRSSTTSQELQSPHSPKDETTENSIFPNSDIVKCTRTCSSRVAKSNH